MRVVEGDRAPRPPAPRSGRATVVVVAYGVDALVLDWVPPTVPVVVVHNDDRLDEGSVGHPRVTHVHPGSNIGFGAGVNAALAVVATPRVVLCNPDVRAGWHHWEALGSGDPDELVVVDQVDDAGRPASVVNRYPTPAATLLTAVRAGRLAPRGSRRRRALSLLLGRWGRAHADSLEHRTASPEGATRFRLAEHWPSAALVSVDTALLRSVGGFDDGYFLYWEDVDLARRLSAAAPDAHVRVAPVPPAVHRVGGSVVDEATGRAVAHQRWRSAARYAAGQQGARWRLVTAMLAAGAAVTSRRAGTGAPVSAPRSTRDGGRRVVAVVHATRRPSGEVRRLESWLELLGAAGFDPVPVPVLGGDGHERRGRTTGRRPAWCGWRGVWEVARGGATPETLVWSRRRATGRLAALDPSAVVCVTLRAYSPAWSGRWPVVVDLVDPLSQSYRQRAGLARTAGARVGYAVLARATGRAEARVAGREPTVAAGWTDAHRLGIPWIPITLPASPATPPVTGTAGDDGDPRWQALFVGSLDYPPNVDAVRRLATTVWPAVRARLPRAVLGIAGRRATPEVIALAGHPGVELIGEFDDLVGLARSARVSVSPLRHATGFQIKVLDAAAARLPQVVSPVALAGFEPGLSVRAADGDQAIADAVVALLGDPAGAASMAERAHAQVMERYGVERWAPAVANLLADLVTGNRQAGGAPAMGASPTGPLPGVEDSRP
ncbi:MAG: glycosyltransferase [Acidimicrobiales bacterium]